MSWLDFFIVASVWILLAGVRSIRIESSDISAFELHRRAQKKHHEALRIIEREGWLPDVRALRYVMETLLFIIFIAVSIALYGFEQGLLVTLAGLLLLPAASQLPLVARRAQKIFDQREGQLMQLARRWHPFLKWFESKGFAPTQQIHSREEFLYLASRADDVFSKDEVLLLQHGLDFQRKIVTEVMTPQSVIDFVEEDEVVGAIVLDRLHKTGHSRFPVIKGDVNHVTGMLYMHDLVPLDTSQRTVKQAMSTQVYYVRSDATLEHALHAFLRTHHHLFIVVNEYRETVGILSLEDVIEALLGRKIIDEFDAFHDLRAVAETNPRKNNQPKKHEDV